MLYCSNAVCHLKRQQALPNNFFVMEMAPRQYKFSSENNEASMQRSRQEMLF